MNKDDLLILKPKVYIKPDVLTKMRDGIMKQKEEGVIVVPSFCEVICAPKDIEIIVEGDDLPNEQRR